MNKKINSNKRIFSNDIFQPIIAYSLFTLKYILKKKSTILMPIFSFILILVITIVPNFIENFPPELFTTVFLTMISSFSIVLVSVFSSIKALNLFKDICNEGMEILIISKPIERWQIIFVRFMFFIFLGVFISFVDYTALLIGLKFINFEYLLNLNIFQFISIYFFSMLLIYLFFGSLSILLSLKFSTKLVNSLTMGIIGFGTIFAQIVPQVIPIIEKDFEDQLLGTLDSYSYTLTDDGNVLIFKNYESEKLDYEAKSNLKKHFDSRDDLSWIQSINNFVNPISGVYKIVNQKQSFFLKDEDNAFSLPKINFSDYKVSLKQEVKILKNNYDNKNHFIANQYTLVSSVFQIKTKGKHEGFEYLNVSFENNFSNYILRLLSDSDHIYNQFYETLKNIKDYDKSKPENLREKIIKDFREKQSFESLFKKIYDEELKDDWSNVLNFHDEITSFKGEIFEREVFESEVIMFLFYLCGLNKINSNFNQFDNKDKGIFLDSAIQGEFNDFLGLKFKLNPINNSENGGLLIKSYDPNIADYSVFFNDGEKISVLTVASSWTIINILILSVAVIIYYRRDFV